jgi:hypothetical protein
MDSSVDLERKKKQDHVWEVRRHSRNKRHQRNIEGRAELTGLVDPCSGRGGTAWLDLCSLAALGLGEKRGNGERGEAFL